MIIFIDKGGSNYLLFYFVVLLSETNQICSLKVTEIAMLEVFWLAFIGLTIYRKKLFFHINCGRYSK